MPKKPTPTTGDPLGETPDPLQIRQALNDLGLNVPYYWCRLVGNRLEFHLYGGITAYWPPEAKVPAPSPAAQKPPEPESAPPPPKPRSAGAVSGRRSRAQKAPVASGGAEEG